MSSGRRVRPNEARDTAIAEMYRRGAPEQLIADFYCLSRQRIHQILVRDGVETRSEAEAALTDLWALRMARRAGNDDAEGLFRVAQRIDMPAIMIDKYLEAHP